MSTVRLIHPEKNLVPVSCNRDCGGGCPLVAEFRDGKPCRIIDNPLRPDHTIRGCPKGYRALEIARSDQRLTSPLKRIGARGAGEFIPLSWSDALGEIAEKLFTLKAQYGPEALMVLPGAGSCRGKVHSTGGLVSRLFSCWGNITTPSGYYSNTAALYATASVFGTGRVGLDSSMLEGAQLVILWGANISDLRFGVKLEPVLRNLKRDGVPFYVVDPRWTRSAEQFLDTSPDEQRSSTSRWLAVRPGTDAALMAAVLYQLITHNTVDRQFITTYTCGFSALENWVRGSNDGIAKTPKWAAGICGLPVNQIVNFARDIGTAHPAALIPGLSIQRVLGGEEAYRMAIALQAARGNIGIPGGTPGSCLWHSMPGPQIDSIGSVLTPLPQAGDDAPGARISQPNLVPINNWQDAVIEGRSSGWPTDIRGIYGVGNNFLLQSSDCAKSIAAFEAVDFSVCHDLFLTGTALYSDYVLPATHFLERDDIVSAGENYLYYSNKILDPPGEARDDYDILYDLAERLGIGHHFSHGRGSEDWLDVLLEDSEIGDIGHFKATGIHDGKRHDRIGLAGFINDPAGNPLPTASGRIEFSCPENLQHGYPEHPHYRPETPSGFPLMMITPHARYRINSQNSNLPWFKEKEYPLVHMNPEDADARRLKDGMKVTINSAQGTMTMPLKISEGIRPGVIWALQGSWDVPDAVNHLTSTTSTLPSYGSRTHSIRVEVVPHEPEIAQG